MDTLQTLSVALGISALAGLRLYLTVFMTSLAINQGWLKLASQYESLGILGSEGVLIASGALLVVEFLADKVQGFDSLWDSIHTFIRPIGATLLAMQVLGEWPPETQIIAALCLGGVTLSVHAAKASTRLLVNTSPEPFSNAAVSLAEDVVVAGMFGLLVTHPYVAGTIFVAGLIGVYLFLPKAMRLIKTTASLVMQRVSGTAQTHEKLTQSATELLTEKGLRAQWTVPGYTGRARQQSGWTANRAALIAKVDSAEGTQLAVITRAWGRTRLALVSLAQSELKHQSRWLSEDLTVQKIGSKQKATVRFAKPHRALCERALADMAAKPAALSTEKVG
jgi:hypothetical protein